MTTSRGCHHRAVLWCKTRPPVKASPAVSIFRPVQPLQTSRRLHLLGLRPFCYIEPQRTAQHLGHSDSVSAMLRSRNNRVRLQPLRDHGLAGVSLVAVSLFLLG